MDGKANYAQAIKKMISLLDYIPNGYIIDSSVKDNPSMEVKMKEQVKWNTSKGQQVTVTAELITSETLNLDGDKHEAKCCKLNITAEVEGMGVVAYSEPYKANNLPTGVVAVMGGKLALNQENYDRVMDAINKIKSSEAWQQKMKSQAAALKAEQDLESHHQKIKKAMDA